MKALPLPSPKVLLSLRSNRYYGQLRLPYRPSEISSPYIHPLLSCIASGRASRAIPHGFPCVSPLLPRKSHLSALTVFVRTDVPAFPLRPWGRQLHFLNYEATFRFARAATRRSVRLETEFARPTQWAFVKELRVLGYPSHLLQATWANCRIPMVPLYGTSHASYTAYGHS
jgi:hypothetical protein